MNFEFPMPICSIDQPVSPYIVGSLALAGLVGSFTHCAGMCSPFVLAQSVDGQTRLGRLAHATRLPYHAGRATTYMLLGALAGGLGAEVAPFPGFRLLSTALLLVAALFFLTQVITTPLPRAVSTRMRRPSESLGRILSRIARPLLARPGWTRFYLLGIVLGFLPCGLLYSALTAAAATASVAWGAIGMTAFAATTATALVVIGWSANLATRRWRAATQWFAKPFQVANAVLLAVLAINVWQGNAMH